MKLVIRKYVNFYKLYNKDTSVLYSQKFKTRAAAVRKKKSMEVYAKRRIRT